MSEPDDLPAPFKEARAKDEPFWISQEQRIQGSLGQPCCTLSGISTGLINMSGNFAVIVHGEDECAACFRHIGPNTHNFFCTGLTEKHFVTGETAEPLRRCLRLVAEEVNPNAIFVLGACPVEVIGDRFETVVQGVQEEFPQIPMAALHTSGLKVGSQAAMLDWMFSALADMPTVEPVETSWKRRLGHLGLDMMSSFLSGDWRAMDWAQGEAAKLPAREPLDPLRSLNLFGLPTHSRRGSGGPEYGEVLAESGLQVVANYPRDATFEDWRAVKFAKATFIADRSLYPKLVNVLEGSGQTVLDVPIPTGVDQTTEFYDTIGRVLGVEETMQASIAERKAAAEQTLADFKAEHGGLRVAMGLRMLNNYEVDQIAYQGLGDYRALAEMGFDLTIMVQGPPDRRDRFAQMFERRGIHHPFIMFPEPWTLSEHLDGDRFDVAYLADHCRAECRKAGVPMIVSRALEPYFSGVEPNLRHMERMISTMLST